MSWVCDWCVAFGCYPLSKATRPDSEEPVITQDGEKICQSCATKWFTEKQKQRDDKE